MPYHLLKVGSSGLQEAESIMSEVYKENPKHWPHGLSTAHMDGGLWLVRSASDNKSVGFVGWQERNEGLKKVGYYSIGIKKSHRRQGYATEAVKKIIKEKSASVDVVKAYVASDNYKSIGMAKNLPVDLELAKSANIQNLLKTLKGGWDKSKTTLGGMAGGAAAGGLESWAFGYDPTSTKINTFLTSIMGGALPHLKGPGKFIEGPYGKKLELGTANVPKMGIIAAVDMADKYIKSQKDLADTKLDTAKITEETAKVYKLIVDDYGLPALIGAGILGTGATSALLIDALRKRKPTKINISNPKSKGKKGIVSVDIPRENISEDFYRSLSRDLLFDSPAEKRRKAKKILEETAPSKEQVKKKAALLVRHEALRKQANVWNSLKSVGKLFAGGAGTLGSRTSHYLTSDPKFWKSVGKLGLGAGTLGAGLTGADAVLGTRMAPGIANFFTEPFRDAYRDFREGSYLKAMGNAGLGALWMLPVMSSVGLAARLPAMLGGAGIKTLGRTIAGSGIKPFLRKGLGLTSSGMPLTTTGLTGANALGTGIYNFGRQVKNWGRGVDRAADYVSQPLARGLAHVVGRPFGQGAHNFSRKWLQAMGATRPNTWKRLGVSPLQGIGAGLGGWFGLDALRSPLRRENRFHNRAKEIASKQYGGILPEGWGMTAAKLLGADPYKLS